MTAKGNRVFILATNSSGREYRKGKAQLETMIKSFRADFQKARI